MRATRTKSAAPIGLAAAAALVASLWATPSMALDSSFDALSVAGKHRFYVWCTGRDDYVASQNGSNARAAQAALASRAGSNCWPVWQGREN